MYCLNFALWDSYKIIKNRIFYFYFVRFIFVWDTLKDLTRFNYFL